VDSILLRLHLSFSCRYENNSISIVSTVNSCFNLGCFSVNGTKGNCNIDHCPGKIMPKIPNRVEQPCSQEVDDGLPVLSDPTKYYKCSFAYNEAQCSTYLLKTNKLPGVVFSNFFLKFWFSEGRRPFLCRSHKIR
jgi:hypothetical protein